MQQPQPAGLGVDGLLAADRVGADGGDLHVVKPLDQLLAVFQTGLVKLAVGEKGVLALLVEAVEPAGVQDDDVVLFDLHALCVGRSEQVVEAHPLAPLQVLFALVAGGVDQDAVADDAPVGNRLDRALLQRANRRFGIVAVIQLVPVPGVAQGVVLGRALGEHDDHVVGVLEPAGEGLSPAADVRALVVGLGADRLGADRVQGIALGAGDRDAEHEGLALFDRPDAAQDLSVGQEVETADLVVGPPTAPVLGCILEYLGMVNGFVWHTLAPLVSGEWPGRSGSIARPGRPVKPGPHPWDDLTAEAFQAGVHLVGT